MASEDQSIHIVAPPSSGTGGADNDEKEDDPQLEDDGGLLSTTPSSVPQGPLVSQLDQLMTIIHTFRKENNDLRNQLNDQNLVIQHKTKNLQQINDNYREYDDMVKQKYGETAEKFKALRKENIELKEVIDQLNKRKDEDAEATSEEDSEETSMRSWITLDMEKTQGNTDHSTAEYRRVKNQLNMEQEKLTEVTKELMKAKQVKEMLETKLEAALNDVAKNKDERKRENQELRTTMGAELNGYKQRVQVLADQLAESKQNLALHSRKVQELYEANLQFDEVNSAYHNKIAMYVEELKKRDAYVEQLKLQHKQVLQRITNEKQDMQELVKKYDRVQEALRTANKQGFENRRERDTLTARVVSMEESLGAREQKLKAAEDSIQLLQTQLQQYEDDFGGERMAREQIHHQVQEKEAELVSLRRKCDSLQGIVNQYTEDQMKRLSSQYQSSPSQTPPVTPPSPNQYHNPNFGTYERAAAGTGYGYSEYHPRPEFREEVQHIHAEEIQQQHKCPVCSECFAEHRSLEIHVNTHFSDN